MEILAAIAEHRVLNVHHLGVLLERNTAALRRRLKLLREQNLIRVSTRAFGSGRGRPEHMLSLHEDGVDLLRAKGLIDVSLPYDVITAKNLHCVEHELVISDFRVQLVQMGRILPVLSVRFFSSTSPGRPGKREYRPLIRERIPTVGGRHDDVEFEPDGVFAITYAEREKTLLFFLEVDMGTEPHRSSQNPRRSVRQKIINYQAYFQLERYRRYEKILQCALQGFRLLFLTATTTGLVALSRLVRSTPPCDFIWLTARDKLLSQGVWAPIWVRGGQPESVRLPAWRAGRRRGKADMPHRAPGAARH
ncbi:MAG: replication-relaxation family protein [Phycisphaerae bacterium]|jgi:hypothetical protein